MAPISAKRPKDKESLRQRYLVQIALACLRRSLFSPLEPFAKREEPCEQNGRSDSTVSCGMKGGVTIRALADNSLSKFPKLLFYESILHFIIRFALVGFLFAGGLRARCLHTQACYIFYSFVEHRS